MKKKKEEAPMKIKPISLKKISEMNKKMLSKPPIKGKK